ncbi:MAG TPA: hypothetical protein PKX90_08315 [bacterium]|nr:hypothetical protein [bacterium]
MSRKKFLFFLNEPIEIDPAKNNAKEKKKKQVQIIISQFRNFKITKLKFYFFYFR